MSIKVYNSMSREKEEFTPVHPGEVRMYVCGPTVYDYLHIGNYRGLVFFNVVRNWLEKRGYQVTYIYNYTDVDDKIMNRAREEGVEPSEISEKYIKEFEKDFAYLKLRPHSKNPRVTEYMENIVEFVRKLIDNGKAYEVDGDVYFDVHSYDGYGKLSNKNLDELEAGYRIELSDKKKHSADFALWKAAKEGEKSWPSPWGLGRPGWHIECSTMSQTLLGETIDIHGGGLDLVFPHHENEIAQSEGCSGKTFVKYWMHNNMLDFGGKKMSKSLGNVRTGRNFLEEYDGEILKYLMLSSHYRNVIDFNDEQIDKAIHGLARIYSALSLAEQIVAKNVALAPLPEKFEKLLDEANKGIEAGLDDDFNTAEVFGKIFEVVRAFNNYCRTPGKVKPEQGAVAETFLHWLRETGKVLALFGESPQEYLKLLDDMLLKKKGLQRSEIDQLVAARTQARANKDFALSDQLRDRLTELGIAVQDAPEGSTWEVAK